MITWPDQLVSDLARRRAVVMIGSGVSRHSKGEGGLVPPTWGGFLSSALQLCNPKPKHIRRALERGHYLDACEWLKKALDERWTPLMMKSFLEPRFKPAEIHKHIYDLDCRIVLTPNFDKIYDNYASTMSEGTTLIKTHVDIDVVEYIRRGDRIVVKAHGSIDDQSNLIFTRTEYAKARTKYASFYRMFDAILMTNTVLMIGVGLDDPDF